MRSPIAPLLAAFALLSAPARAARLDLDCGRFEAPPKEPPSEPAPGTKTPMSRYDGDWEKDPGLVWTKVLKAFNDGREKPLLTEMTNYIVSDVPDCFSPAWASRKLNKVVICPELFEFVRNRHQLAAVLGHELVHIDAAHEAAMEKLEDELLTAYVKAKLKIPRYFEVTTDVAVKKEMEELFCPRLNKLSRAQEDEADLRGVRLAAKAGFDPKEAAQTHLQFKDLLWAARVELADGTVRWGERETAASHPAPTDRAKGLAREAERLEREKGASKP